MVQQGLDLRSFWKKLYISKTVHHEVVKTQKIHANLAKIHGNLHKILISARLLVKIHASQVFLDPIQNLVSKRSVHLEAAYLQALL